MSECEINYLMVLSGCKREREKRELFVIDRLREVGGKVEGVKNEEMKKSVQQIQEHLVVVPVDKAGHNIAFICQA